MNKSTLKSAVFKVEMQGHNLRSVLAPSTLKALGDMGTTRASYNAAIVDALTGFASGDAGLVVSRNNFRRAMALSFSDAFETGWMDGGGDLPVDDADANAWLGGREDEELGYIEQVFVDLRERMRLEGFDYFNWATDKADSYTATLNDIYNQGKLRAAPSKMLTFDGDDGKESCATCVRLKGARHKASWWIEHDLIPYAGNVNLECGGYNCHHGLRDDQGNWYTQETTKSMKSSQVGDGKADIKPAYMKYWCTLGEFAVWIVDGEYLRSWVWLDFTQGGNPYRYAFIPVNELWLENDTMPEASFILLHEITEARWFQRGLDYDAAHDKANIAERAARADPLKLPQLLKAAAENKL